jgi:hypothetical protein
MALSKAEAKCATHARQAFARQAGGTDDWSGATQRRLDATLGPLSELRRYRPHDPRAASLFGCAVSLICDILAQLSLCGRETMIRLITPVAFGLGALLSLTACTDPYDPGQRALGGAALGAGTGAAIGAIAGGGRGAATGALIGGAVGAVGGAATTPPPPGPPPGYYPTPQASGYYPPSSYPPGSYPPGSYPPGYYPPPGDNPPGYYR